MSDRVVRGPALGAATLLALLGAVLAALAWGAPHAGAHALVRATEPPAEAVTEAPPERVLIRFTEPVEAAFGAIRVYDTSGRRVDDGLARHVPGEPETVTVGLAGDLPDGTYTVSWRVVSADGHPVSEAFVFHVGAPGAESASAVQRILDSERSGGAWTGLVHAVSRWVLFAGIALLVGGWAFTRFTLGAHAAAVAAAVDRRRERLLRWAWAGAAAATLVGMVAQIALAAALPLHRAATPALLAELLSTRYGMVAAARLAVLLAAAAVWWRARGSRRVAVTLLVVLAATPALSGHAGASDPAALHLVADTLHLLAAGVWIGGLVLLFAALRPGGTDEAALPGVVGRFSTVALRAVALLVLTGVVRSTAEIGALRALWSTAYGTVLLAKLAVFLPMLAMAAWNRFRVQPRLARAGGGQRGLLRRLVASEATLAAVVLVLTAVLVNLPPGRVEAGIDGPFVTEASLGDGAVQVIVDPNVVGENIVHVTMQGSDGRPLEVEGLVVRFRMPEEDIGPLEGDPIRLGPGHYAVQGRQLSLPGRWLIELRARIDEFTDLRADVAVVVNG